VWGHLANCGHSTRSFHSTWLIEQRNREKQLHDYYGAPLFDSAHSITEPVETSVHARPQIFQALNNKRREFFRQPRTPHSINKRPITNPLLNPAVPLTQILQIVARTALTYFANPSTAIPLGLVTFTRDGWRKPYETGYMHVGNGRPRFREGKGLFFKSRNPICGICS
jgi:hypothetical protein